MTSTQMLIALLWVGTGLFSALLMGRRGHRHWYWTLVALLLGPLAWPVLAERRSGEAPHVQQLSAGQATPGLHLLAGIDGSEESAHAAAAAAHLLRSTVGRITLATVVDYDTESIGGRRAGRACPLAPTPRGVPAAGPGTGRSGARGATGQGAP